MVVRRKWRWKKWQNAPVTVGQVHHRICDGWLAPPPPLVQHQAQAFQLTDLCRAVGRRPPALRSGGQRDAFVREKIPHRLVVARSASDVERRPAVRPGRPSVRPLLQQPRHGGRVTGLRRQPHGRQLRAHPVHVEPLRAKHVSLG